MRRAEPSNSKSISSPGGNSCDEGRARCPGPGRWRQTRSGHGKTAGAVHDPPGCVGWRGGRLAGAAHTRARFVRGSDGPDPCRARSSMPPMCVSPRRSGIRSSIMACLLARPVLEARGVGMIDATVGRGPLQPGCRLLEPQAGYGLDSSRNCQYRGLTGLSSERGMPMDVRLLGAIEVCADGISLVLGGPKQRAVLADLALHVGQVVATAQLIDDLWGARPPASAKPRPSPPGHLSQHRQRAHELRRGRPGPTLRSRRHLARPRHRHPRPARPRDHRATAAPPPARQPDNQAIRPGRRLFQDFTAELREDFATLPRR